MFVIFTYYIFSCTICTKRKKEASNKQPQKKSILYKKGSLSLSLSSVSSIGAGSRGAASPLEIFWPPLWTTFSPLRLLSWAIFGTKNAPAKTLFG